METKSNKYTKYGVSHQLFIRIAPFTPQERTASTKETQMSDSISLYLELQLPSKERNTHSTTKELKNAQRERKINAQKHRFKIEEYLLHHINRKLTHRNIKLRD